MAWFSRMTGWVGANVIRQIRLECNKLHVCCPDSGSVYRPKK